NQQVPDLGHRLQVRNRAAAPAAVRRRTLHDALPISAPGGDERLGPDRDPDHGARRRRRARAAGRLRARAGGAGAPRAGAVPRGAGVRPTPATPRTAARGAPLAPLVPPGMEAPPGGYRARAGPRRPATSLRM